MTDRDHFAAAALTGLLYPDVDDEFAMPYIVGRAYLWSDAMLRERSRAGQNSSEGTASDAKCTERDSHIPNAGKMAETSGETNHDAAPAATAAKNDGPPRERKVPDGTGDTPATHATHGEGSEQREGTEPVAWGVAGHKGLLYATAISRMDAVDMQSEHECGTEVVPLYRHPPVTEPMPTEKRAEVCAGPLAWAAIRENGQPLWLSYDRSGEEGMVNGMAEVVPLYRSPTLTDAEREVVESAIWDYEQNDDDDGCARMVAVLRGLLARLGGGE